MTKVLLVSGEVGVSLSSMAGTESSEGLLSVFAESAIGEMLSDELFCAEMFID